ncbi:MAG: hypothetical protein ACUVR4_05845 [Anaerolineae bacterium]
MITIATVHDPKTAAARPPRKRWDAPAIVLERSLEVAAQGGPPNSDGPPSGFLGPLGTSGGSGQCI